MKFGKSLATIAAAGSLYGAAACSNPEQAIQTPTTTEQSTTTQTHADPTWRDKSSTSPNYPTDPTLKFDNSPDHNFSAGDCYTNTNSWVVYIDSDVNDVESEPHEVGLRNPHIHDNRDGRPFFVLGATILGLGNASYQIATTEKVNQGSENIAVNLRQSPYSEVLKGEDGYEAVFTARMGNDNNAYFTLNCLPNFGFSGDMQQVPLDELPTIPPSTEPKHKPSDPLSV